MLPFEIRAVQPGDEEELLDVARHLDSVNLPHDPVAISEIVQHSHRSFRSLHGVAGDDVVQNPRERTYVFALIDKRERGLGEHGHEGRIVGTSMVIAQLGRRGAPYIYLDVYDEEKYSASVEKHFVHTVLRIGYSYNGPTEIGGLVIRPEYRRTARLGTMISYVRFLFLAVHRDVFMDEVLAELMPPLEPDGRSHLWEALGRRFTDMTYQEADRLSKKNKEFIKALFPESPIYATVLSDEARAVLGKTGAQTRGVEKLLMRIGFRYAHRVDPFDGGPHFTARMDEVSLVHDTRRTRADRPLSDTSGTRRALVAVETPAPPFLRCVLTGIRDEGARGVALGEEAWETLGLHHGSPLVVLPVEL